MNKRQVIILWIIALALGASVAIVKLTERQSSQSSTQRAPGETLFESFPAIDVSTVEIKGATESVTLTKKGDTWTLTQRDDYPVNPSFVNDLLRTLKNLKVTRSMEAGPSFAPRFGMDETATKPEDHGLTAVFKDASGNKLAQVTLGKNIESAASASPMGGASSVGRYIRNHADKSGFYAVSELFPAISVEAPRWLATDFISPEKIQSIALSPKDNDGTDWKLTRESEQAEFKLEGAKAEETLNTTEASPLKNLFSYARFDDVVPAADVEKRSASEGKRTATIETFEGFTYTITLTPTNAPAKPLSGSGPNYLLSFTVDAELPKERKKEEDEKPEDAIAKDKAFTDRLKTLTEKLEKEKALAGRTFEVGDSTVQPLLKDRATLTTKASAAPAGNPNGGVQQLPGGLIAPSPRGIQAVTSPIAVPPMEEEEYDEEDEDFEDEDDE